MKRYPLVEEISPHLTAPEAFELFKDRRFSFFLDSGMDPLKLGRYSFIGSDPFLVLRSRGKEIAILGQDREESRLGNPFDVLGEMLQAYTLDPHPSVPFIGGAVGYFSYDLCHFIERLPSTALDDLQLPECYFAFYDAILAFDYLDKRVYVVSTGFPELEEDRRRRRARERLEELKASLVKPPLPKVTTSDEGRQELSVIATPTSRGKQSYPSHRDCFVPRNDVPSYFHTKLHSSLTREEALPQNPAEWVTVLRPNFTHQAYLQAVERAREYIAAGDIFQVNLSQRFEADLSIPPYELYKRLRQVNPAPFACCLNFGGVTVVSASPERFLKLQGDLVETRPIKGTRPRGNSQAEDEALARELQGSIKDRAENVMIVDLERNDLGRVCRFGTVRVRELITLERYATVFHLTSTVEGRLRQDRNRIDLLKACFPGGSITGAPKVRAMEIIDELEPTRRSVYTGSIGYLSFGGELDLNIVIRTILIKDGKAYFQVGGGIVYDSDPEAEYRETLDKARALFQALSMSPELEVVR